MAHSMDITDYNYFDVEDFSVDSFFRSLELQSKFASTDLEFSFPADLENVPISACLTSVGFLDSTTAKSTDAVSRLSAVEDSCGCRSGLTDSVAETSIADDNDDDNADAVFSFFQSLQLRSCLLRADDETVPDSSRSTDISHNIPGLFSQSRHAGVSDVSKKPDRTLIGDERDADIRHRNRSDVCLAEKSTNFDRLSSVWTCCSVSQSEDYEATEQSSAAVVSRSDTTTASTHAHKRGESASPADVCEDQRCRQGQAETAATVAETVASKSGKMSCDVCAVELSSKYSFVRHLSTPLHRRRADGYCTDRPHSATASTNNTPDIIQLMSKKKPVQCRVCHFYGDTSSQLLQHITTSSHCSRVKTKLLQCLPCQFVGTSDNMTQHVRSESHATLVKQCSRPSIISAYRRRGQVVCARTQRSKVCSDCGEQFPSASSLEIHSRRRHTGHRPFICTTCHKSYCDNSTLRLHYKTAQHQRKCALFSV